MGLSPYGNPEKYDLSPFLSVSETGYYCDVSFIRSNPPARSVYEPSYSEKLVELLGEPRKPGSEITRRHMDIAAAVQFALERAAVSLIQYLHSRTGLRNLALAGGVALNCAANRIITELPFIDRLFVQPAASDRGLALGCALYMANQEGCPAQPLKHAFYGPTYSLDDLRETLRLTGATFCECNNPAEKAARLLCEGKIVGWYQGRSEFGPRALGNRSILADPSSLEMKDLVNAKIKFRESFRPFAPAVLEEHAAELFEIPYASPFMTITFKTRAEWRNKLQAVNHVNNTARVQTVSKDTNPLFHDLITHFHAAAGIPCVLNTSYNVRGQPIVETVKDALTTFAASGMDAVFIGPFLLEKQPCCS
ncbi:MAG: hypothetical protein D6719_11525 [Candidatus Dadabacteria bacterium]|nr:MAG: hypothetical protein D6719_11525 [Candidatus Dadabacteria bacterium]